MRSLARLLNRNTPIGFFITAFLALTFYVWCVRILGETAALFARAVDPEAAGTISSIVRRSTDLKVSVDWIALGLFISLFTSTPAAYGFLRTGRGRPEGIRDWSSRYGWLLVALALTVWTLALPLRIRASADPIGEGSFRLIVWVYRCGYYWGWLLFVALLDQIWLNGRNAELYSLLVTGLYWGGRFLASNPASQLPNLVALPFAFVACMLTIKLRRGGWAWTLFLVRENITRLL